METISFVLGIAFVVVIAVAVVAVYSFVKVLNIAEELSHLRREIDSGNGSIYQYVDTQNRHIHIRIDDLEKEVFSQLDSRLDKLENRLVPKEAIKNKTN